MVTAQPNAPHGSSTDVATTADPTGPGKRSGGVVRVADGLGWFSVALGAAEVLAPGRVSRLIGIRDTPATRRVVRAMGVRELSVVPGIFNRPRPAGFLAARVAGDVLDLALLGVSLGRRRNDRRRLAAAAVAVAGVTVVDAVTGWRASRSADPSTSGSAIRARGALTINRPVGDVYRYWRRLENLPTFMAHLLEVREDVDGRSHWKAAAPAGRTVEWDAEVIEDAPDEVIAWRSTEGADVPNRGSVRFSPAPGGRGTEVTVDLEYEPPAGAVGAAIAQLFGEEPGQQLADDLRRFKQVMETGEVARSDGSPDGTRTQRQYHQHDGHPVG